MDKAEASENLKKYLGLAQKHRFWILCVLVMVVAVPVYTLEANSLQAMRTKYEAVIGGRLREIDQLRGSQSAPPAEQPVNDHYIQGVSKEGEEIKNQAFLAWERAYDLQQKNLAWPKELADEMSTLPPGKEISEIFRGIYGVRVVKPEWDRVFEKVHLRRPREGAVAQPGNAGMAAADMEGIVEWDARQREGIKNRYVTNVVPSDLRVRLTQEDLWIFESLIDIINKVNGGALDNLAAKIRRIEKLEVGRWAIEYALARPAGNIRIEGLIVDTGSGQQQQETDERRILLAGRYLDANNQPVSAEDFETKPPFTEFKQVFVVMRLVMDQREIPALLAACANSYLPIEARQVWMEFSDIDSIAAAAPGVPGPPRDPGRGHYDCTVEIRGIVYIYNRPDKEQLGKGAAPEPAKRSAGIPSSATAPAPIN